MAISEQIVRQLDVLRELVARRYGITTRELAELYGVSTRTVERDLDDLCEAGFPIYSEKRGRENEWKLLHTRSLPPVNFPVEEVLSLTFVEALLGPLEGTPFRDSFERTLRRIRATLPDKARAFLEEAAGTYYAHTRGRKPFPAPETFRTLNEAMAAHKVCNVTYRALSTGLTRTYPVEPLWMFHHYGGFYLLCRVPAHGSLITLSVERILALEATERLFDPPPDLSVEDHLEDAFGIVADEPFELKVRFSAEQAPYMRERIWHPTQEMEDQADGGIVLGLRAGGRFEIRSWILSYGVRAEVLEPQWLRDEIREELRRNLDIYDR